jgi:hypothetical protein
MTSKEKKLYKIIKKEFKVRIRNFDKEEPLIRLAEKIAIEKEKKPLPELYQMYIGSKELHLPGWIAAILAASCGLDLSKVNLHFTVGDILDQL